MRPTTIKARSPTFRVIMAATIEHYKSHVEQISPVRKTSKISKSTLLLLKFSYLTHLIIEVRIKTNEYYEIIPRFPTPSLQLVSVVFLEVRERIARGSRSKGTWRWGDIANRFPEIVSFYFIKL
jgi:hypothetical protein